MSSTREACGMCSRRWGSCSGKEKNRQTQEKLEEQLKNILLNVFHVKWEPNQLEMDNFDLLHSKRRWLKKRRQKIAFGSSPIVLLLCVIKVETLEGL